MNNKRGRTTLRTAVSLAAACGAIAACEGRDPAFRITDPPAPVEVTAVVNIQLGNTPAGQAPQYIITGQVRATQDGRNVASAVDSVVVFHRRTEETWTRLLRQSAFPVTGALPFTAVAGESYSVLARLYGRGWVTGDTVTVLAERSGTGAGY